VSLCARFQRGALCARGRFWGRKAMRTTGCAITPRLKALEAFAKPGTGVLPLIERPAQALEMPNKHAALGMAII